MKVITNMKAIICAITAIIVTITNISCVERELWRDPYMVESHIIRDYGEYITLQELPIKDFIIINDTLICEYIINNIVSCKIVDLEGCDLGEGFPEVKRPPYPVGYILVNVTYNIYDDCKVVANDGIIIDSGSIGVKVPIELVVFDFMNNELEQVDFDWDWVNTQMRNFLNKYMNKVYE